ncbi:hypothetical protein PTSG_08862 [Salpingoeca rosetta]|uniref:Uncharacterized protein n=1 Tax=Salpingoeca rosetta (strain ATCC 50818 / BSB-021) TaxID=946362 RepID=F2UKX3_SALR5|nr:uncharacterized protein PTSG_08862 [Salpingoeca rosetta]EGD77772.1 hypothetical protein PTSG_08862 [Salpingoeca rosetta]|eukprot:XP_004990248.1 hypothetical protein PTSG_08862 [Salpingoeca rosetta]
MAASLRSFVMLLLACCFALAVITGPSMMADARPVAVAADAVAVQQQQAEVVPFARNRRSKHSAKTGFPAERFPLSKEGARARRDAEVDPELEERFRKQVLGVKNAKQHRMRAAAAPAAPAVSEPFKSSHSKNHK